MTHSVQVGAFLVAQNAREQAAALSARGYPAGILAVADAKGRTWHLVRIGDFPSAEAAQAKAAEFSRTERIPAAVRPYGRF
jgi:cell division septation protein DedD